MPCQDWDHEEHDERQQQRLDALSLMLCWLCARVGVQDDWPDDLKAWWAEHERADAAAREAEINKAITRVHGPAVYHVGGKEFADYGEAFKHAAELTRKAGAIE